MNQPFTSLNIKKTKTFALILLAWSMGFMLFGCSTTSEPEIISDSTISEPEIINDFPTYARVDYVLECMNNYGGQSYQTLYPCVCSADKVAESMTYNEYSEAQTIIKLQSVRGERGAVFRDPPRSRELHKRLQQAKTSAAEMCNLVKN